VAGFSLLSLEAHSLKAVPGLVWLSSRLGVVNGSVVQPRAFVGAKLLALMLAMMQQAYAGILGMMGLETMRVQDNKQGVWLRAIARKIGADSNHVE